MTLANLATGASVFVDANVLVYHVSADPAFGPASTSFIRRIEQGDVRGFVSTHVLSELAHKAMLIDASRTFGWPLTGALKRLQNNPALIGQLRSFRLALQQIQQTGIQILTVDPALIDAAAGVSQQTGLLSNDALIVAVMQHHGLTSLASEDADFDRVPGLTRYSPS
jgi:predicted nucleic acid-binding protein